MQAASSNNLLGVVFFSVLFGLGLRATAPRSELLISACSGLAAVMIRITHWIMWTAPFGVMGAAASLVSGAGIEGLGPFLNLLVVSYLTLAVFIIFLLIATSLLARFPLIPFLRSLVDVFVLAFSTASSTAVLPLAFERLEQWGASRRTVSFVLPLGYSFNLSGTSVYLPLVTLFWVQLNGLSLSWADQIWMLGSVLILVRGIPTVPRGFFFVWGALLAQFNLPLEGAMIVLGIDPLIDMARTVVNVAGNCLAVAVVDRAQKQDGAVFSFLRGRVARSSHSKED